MAEMKDAVLITGGSQGMGASHAHVLAKAGWHVYIADVINAAGVVVDITSAGGSASFHTLDVTNSQSWEMLAEELRHQRVSLRGLVNNAGVSHRYGIMATTDADWQRVLDINLSGPFYGMRSMAPLIRDSGGGSIVNISSTSGLIGYHAAAYTASKWGVRGLTKTAATEYAPWGIRVNSIHPGLIDTPMVGGADAFVSSSLESIPTGRAGNPEEVSAAVAFLLSPASSYMTSSELTVDGGLTGSGTYWRINREAAERSKGGDL